MNRTAFSGSVLLASLVYAQISFGNVLTNGLNGINSSSLGLTGAGVDIGQVEPFRPGDPSFDTMGSLFHTSVNPAQVFFRNTSLNFIATMDNSGEIIDPNALTPGHSVWVAGTMISTDTTDPDGAGPMVALTGVATGASLYSIGDNGTTPDFDPESAISSQHIATLPGVNLRAINMSFGNPLVGAHILDGNQLLTQYIDWSASQPQHDILYVVAGNEGSGGIPVPTDNFNGMTIGYSERVGNVWRRVGSDNNIIEDAEGDRTSVSLIAPGDGFEMTTLGSARTMSPHPFGTSFAAPHVTGTVAVLQQYAVNNFAANPNAPRHEVMKAVLMNSVDKFIDNGSVIPPGEADPVPQGGLLGMTRTVLKVAQPGNANPTGLIRKRGTIPSTV